MYCFLGRFVRVFCYYLFYVPWLILWCVGALFGWLLANIIGLIFYLSNKKARRIIKINLTLMQPQLTKYQIIWWGVGSICFLFKNILMTWLFVLASFMPLGYLAPLYSIEGMEHLKRTDRPIIFLYVHSAQVFIVGFFVLFLKKNNYILHSLWKRRAKSRIVGLCESLALSSFSFFGHVWLRKGHVGYRHLLSALLAGESVVLMTDSRASRKEAVFAKFFGIRTSASVAAFRLANRTNAVIIPISSFSAGIFRYKMVIDPPLKDLSPNTPLEEVAEYMNRALERIIMRAPREYIWAIKRLNDPPDGEDSPYKNSHIK